MQNIGKWIGGEKPELKPQVQKALQQIEEAPLNSSLSKKVAYDAGQIMVKLERYCDELRADEARVAEALKQIRADLQEAEEVIHAMGPAIDVVNKMCSRVDGTSELHQTVAAVREINGKPR